MTANFVAPHDGPQWWPESGAWEASDEGDMGSFGASKTIHLQKGARVEIPSTFIGISGYRIICLRLLWVYFFEK